MQSSIRLQAHHVQIGRPLPFDAFDDHGKLLLRKGFVIGSESQLERLLERGLFRLAGPEEAPAGTGPAAAGRPARDTGHKVSVLELVLEVQRGLETLALMDAPGQTGFTARVHALAAQLQRGFYLDPDAAIASIQMCHAGRYGARRMVHSAILGELLLSQTGEGEAERLTVMCAALTMNLSMMDLQDTLYLQRTPPTGEQQAIVRQHPTAGVALLRSLGVGDAVWLDIVGQHHEMIDGSGYPAGLAGAAILRSAQLLAMVDRYGAMATGRGYRAAALPNVVLKSIFMDKGKGVDAGLAGQLVKAVGIYPPGSLVALANGDVAVVVKRTQNASQPVVRCVKTYRGQILEQPRKRATSEPAYAITRLIPMAELGFTVDPLLLWDEGFELDA